MTFSIIVVVSRGVENRDRHGIFLKCFSGLCTQDYPKESFEVVIVDSGSGFLREDIRSLEETAIKSLVNFTYINPSLGNIGPAKARNLGIMAVAEGKTKLKSEVIAFTDDDTLVPKDWLKRFSEALIRDPEAAGVGGITLPPDDLAGSNIFAYYDQYIYNRYPKAMGKSTNINEHPVFSGNIAYKLDALKRIGGFDDSFEPWVYGEDADLKERVAKTGGFLVFSQVVNTHLAQYSWTRFVRQQKSRGAGIIKYRHKHGLKPQSKAQIIFRILATEVAFFYFLAKTGLDVRVVILETVAYFFRQVGKLKYFGRDPSPPAGGSDDYKKGMGIRILFVDHTPLVGGAQLALLRHLKYLNKGDFGPAVAVSFDCPDFNEKLKEVKGIKCYFLNFLKLKPANILSIMNLFFTAINLARAAYREKSDIIVANTERSFYAGFLVSVLLNKKLILIIRDFEYSKGLLKRTAFKVSKYICVSKNIRDFYGLPKPYCEIIYVGSDMEHKLSRIGEEQVKELKTKIRDWDGYTLIGFVGRIITWKGVFLLLESFAEVALLERKIKLVFVGDGPDKEALIEASKKMGIFPQVYFEDFSDDVELWYKTFNIFVQASVSAEPFATTVIEAAFARLPIVATNTGGTPEFIEDEKNGLLVEPEKESMVSALTKLVNDEALRKRLGEAAFQKASSGYTEEKITKEFERVYESV